jgi:hypothetical protein
MRRSRPGSLLACLKLQLSIYVSGTVWPLSVVCAEPDSVVLQFDVWSLRWERRSLCCNPLIRVLVQLLIAFGAVQTAVSGMCGSLS